MGQKWHGGGWTIFAFIYLFIYNRSWWLGQNLGWNFVFHISVLVFSFSDDRISLDGPMTIRPASNGSSPLLGIFSEPAPDVAGYKNARAFFFLPQFPLLCSHKAIQPQRPFHRPPPGRRVRIGARQYHGPWLDRTMDPMVLPSGSIWARPTPASVFGWTTASTSSPTIKATEPHHPTLLSPAPSASSEKLPRTRPKWTPATQSSVGTG